MIDFAQRSRGAVRRRAVHGIDKPRFSFLHVIQLTTVSGLVTAAEQRQHQLAEEFGSHMQEEGEGGEDDLGLSAKPRRRHSGRFTSSVARGL